MEFTRADHPEPDQETAASDLFDEAIARLAAVLPDIPTSSGDGRNLNAATVVAILALFREVRHAREEETWRRRAMHDELREVLAVLSSAVAELRGAVGELANRMP